MRFVRSVLRQSFATPSLALGFQARIGVNTGEVVAGRWRRARHRRCRQRRRPPRAGRRARRDPARRDDAAPRADAVEVEAVEPLAAEGEAEAVTAYRLLRVVEGAPAFERRLDAPLVGRRDELARVRTAFDEALAARTCRLVTAFGPPGIGKTRLAREVATSLEDEASVLVGRCLPYGEGITYWPLAEIFRQAQRGGRMGRGGAAGAPEDVAWAVRKWLESQARTRPLALVFEDIHWAEPPLLDLIEHVADWTRDAPILAPLPRAAGLTRLTGRMGRRRDHARAAHGRRVGRADRELARGHRS